MTPPARPAWRARLVLVLVGLAGWGLDQAVKALVVAHLDPERPVRLLGGLVTLRYITNSGAAFSLGAGYTLVFTVLATAALIVVLAVLLPRVRHLGWAVTLGLLGAGILGNLTDRIVRPPAPLHGQVVDFIQLPHFAGIFNVADMCVTTAAVMIVVLAVILNITLAGTSGRSARAPRRAEQATGEGTSEPSETDR